MNERPERDEPVETKDRAVRGTVGEQEATTESFLPEDRMNYFRRRWNDIQTHFVDEPKTAVQEAHGLVSSLMGEMNEIFSEERADLESQWNRGDEGDTENLRVALTRYRSFFNRLLR